MFESRPSARTSRAQCRKPLLASLFNTYFDTPRKSVTGTIMTQMLPFPDDKVLGLYAQFESGLYGEPKPA
jgi:hypothetical protein